MQINPETYYKLFPVPIVIFSNILSQATEIFLSNRAYKQIETTL